MLKLTGNRKTGPDFKIIYNSWWIFFFLRQHFIPHLGVFTVFFFFARDDESGSQHLSLKETSSPCVTTVQRKQTNPILPVQSLPPLVHGPSSTQRRCTLYDPLASSPSILFLLVLLYAFWLPQGWEGNVPGAAESPENTKTHKTFEHLRQTFKLCFCAELGVVKKMHLCFRNKKWRRRTFVDRKTVF